MNKCKIFGHKPTYMTLTHDEDGGSSAGFACWRCGIRLGWDGYHGFTPLYDKDGKPENVSSEALEPAHIQKLVKGRHWDSVTDADDAIAHKKGIMTMGPIDPDDLPDWVKKLAKSKYD